MVEGARLESVYMGNCIKGSNPFVSAKTNIKPEITNGFRFFYANKCKIKVLLKSVLPNLNYLRPILNI